MNCVNHPELASCANCQNCLRPFCQDCLVQVKEVYYCAQCRIKTNDSRETRASSANLCSPEIAFGLGWIPGVGAICNGEYFKAFVHVMIFGFLISIADDPGLDVFEPLFGLLIAAFYFYMPLEAYHTAKRRLLESRGQLVTKPAGNPKSHNLWTGIILTFMGLTLFLNNIVPGFMQQILKLWPIMLIGFGSLRILSHFRKEKIGEGRG